MSGIVILAVGIGMVLLSAVLFMVSIIYRQTAGKEDQGGVVAGL